MSFKRLDAEDFVVSSDSITSTLWSTDSPTLTTFFTNSVQEAGSSGNYYLSVYQTSSAEAVVQFDVAYCDSLGSGSTLYNNAVPQNSPTKTLYGQYRTLILEDENASFIFGVGNNIITASNFWVINFERARYKESKNYYKLAAGGIKIILEKKGKPNICRIKPEGIHTNHTKNWIYIDNGQRERIKCNTAPYGGTRLNGKSSFKKNEWQNRTIEKNPIISCT